MFSKEFYKRFEEILKEIFNEKNRGSSPMGGFFDNVRFNQLNDNWKKIVNKSDDGSLTSIQYIYSNDWSVPQKDELNELRIKLEKCISNQEFEEAAILRDKIKDFENNSSKVKQLKTELEKAISEQNFERAIEIRDELKKIN